MSGSAPTARVALAPPATAFAALGWAMVVAGGIVAAVNSAAPFAHGSWLAAYLVLVGGAAQIALGSGAAALARSAPARPLRLVLWNVGSVAVPAGVLSDQAALVTLGSVALLAALAGFALAVRGAPRGGTLLLYHAGIVGLAASVIVGSALADAAPGAWL